MSRGVDIENARIVQDDCTSWIPRLSDEKQKDVSENNDVFAEDSSESKSLAESPWTIRRNW